MPRIIKLVIAVAFFAFIAGLMPTIIDTLKDIFIFSFDRGIDLSPKTEAGLLSFLATLKKYLWHIFFIYALFAAFIIFMESRNPDRTILWILALVFVPVLGVIAYLVIGPDFSSYRKMQAFKSTKRKIDHAHFKTDSRYPTGVLLHSCCEADLLLHNKVKILTDGEETFDAIKKEIADAKVYIHLQYFIINDDEIGTEIKDALIAAARRGVCVRVLYDAIGSWRLTKTYTDALKAEGIECHSFMPVSFARFRRKMNYRNHRKIIVIDGKTAFTGGLNIGDEYLGLGPLGYWRDTHTQVEGEVAHVLHDIFLKDWCLRTEENPDAISCEVNLKCEAEHVGHVNSVTSGYMLPMQVAASGVDDPWHSIARGYFSMITRAQKRVWITTPYFVPGQSIMWALTNAALSGVDARLIIPSKKDHFLVFWGTRGYITDLLRAGVRVFFYEKGFVHSKTMMADGDICSIGTCNMDVRSLEINFENQLFIYDKELTKELEKTFENDLKDCSEITLSVWEKRPIIHKMLESFGKLYSAQI